jgi:hypothetical protein
MLRGGGNRKLRIDDDDRKWKVDRARSLIHDKSKPTKQSTKKSYKGKGSKGKAFVNRSVGVNAKKVEDILKPTSLVPTTVCRSFWCQRLDHNLIATALECIL